MLTTTGARNLRHKQQQAGLFANFSGVRLELFAHCPGLWVTTVATLHTVQRWVGEVEAEGQI